MFEFDLQLFAQGGGTVTNATGNYVNAYTGDTTAFSGTNTLTPTMKEYYDTELLENARDELIFQQFGRKQTLPANHGKVVEWRKWNTLPDVDKLTEGVIPDGKKLGMTSQTVEIAQYGEYVSVTDQLDLHAIDDVILGATEELGAAAGKSYDKLVRNVLMENTVVLYADAYTAAGAYSATPSSRADLLTKSATLQCYLTPDMVAKAVTKLRKLNAPYFQGNKYVAVVHPSCVYDLRKSTDWLDAHKYASPEEIFNGEIGELHGVRFVESNLAPVIKSDGNAVYQTMFFGKDAYAVVDPAGAGMETIIHDKTEAGGPLNQFSTVGAKFSMAAKILYPERMLAVESCSSYGSDDEDNTAAIGNA